MNYTLTSATILLILITDPVGNIPIFARALRHVSPQRRTLVIMREVMIAFLQLLGLILVAVAVEMLLRGFKAVAQQINAA